MTIPRYFEGKLWNEELGKEAEFRQKCHPFRSPEANGKRQSSCGGAWNFAWINAWMDASWNLWLLLIIKNNRPKKNVLQKETSSSASISALISYAYEYSSSKDDYGNGGACLRNDLCRGRRFDVRGGQLTRSAPDCRS